MKTDYKEQIISYLHEVAPNAEGVFMDPKRAIFEECVKMNCFYCGKYGRNWRCPPNMPNIDYQKMFNEYDEGLFISYTYVYSDKVEFDNIRTESSVTLHKTLLDMEKWFYNHNMSTAISFGAGSCKLCKGGCGKERCNNPYMSRSPLEATGVNIVKTAKQFGIDIAFPTDNQLMRIGLVMWQYPE